MGRLSLRQRVTLSYGLMGFLLSVVFAIATTVVAEDYERILIEAVLDGQARSYLKALERDPGAPLPDSGAFTAYREADAPAEYRGLANGVHEFEQESQEGEHIGIYGEAGHRLVFLIDVGEIETLEEYLWQTMLFVVIGGTGLSTWLGWLLAQRTIRPVSRLAEAVGALPPRPEQTRLASGLGRDEIGQLAGAIDAYQQRLVDADAAERTFFANASHELRTPIAVIQGAIEVMRDDPVVVTSQLPRLARIDRAVLELGSLLEALLLGARGVPAERESIDLRDAVAEVLARLASTEPEALQRILITGEASHTVEVSRRWLHCILTVLIQRVLSKSPGTFWQLAVNDTGLSLSQPDSGPEPFARVQRSDLGMGLMFVERLCRALGWQLEQALDGDGRLSIRIVTRPPV